MVISMVTTYLVIKDVIHNIKGFHATISAHFKQEIFTAEPLTKIVLNMICYQVSATL